MYVCHFKELGLSPLCLSRDRISHLPCVGRVTESEIIDLGFLLFVAHLLTTKSFVVNNLENMSDKVRLKKTISLGKVAVKKYQLLDGEIETGIGSYNNPPDLTKGRQNVGVATYLKINDRWIRWNRSAAHAYLAESSCLTISEFCEYYKDYLD